MIDLTLDVLCETDVDGGIRVAELDRLVPFVLTNVGASGPWTVAVVLTDDARMRALHNEYLKIDTETDVMTFPLSADETEAHGGDIVVSVERAAEQAADYDHSVADEVRFLVVHGLLHLCGWNDQSPPERTRMWDEQRRLLEAFDRFESGKANEEVVRSSCA